MTSWNPTGFNKEYQDFIKFTGVYRMTYNSEQFHEIDQDFTKIYRIS